MANHGCQLFVASHHVFITRPSWPVTNRSRCCGFDHTAVTGCPGAPVVDSEWIANQGCQLFAASHQVLITRPSWPVTNKSRCCGFDQTAVTGWPGALVADSGWIANHGCQLFAASHHVLITRPSRPVTNRSRCCGFDHTAVTGWPGAPTADSGWIANQDCQPFAPSHHVLITRPSRPVMNKSRCCGFDHTAVTGCPGAPMPDSGWIANHGRQLFAASHQVLITRPSRPVTNK